VYRLLRTIHLCCALALGALYALTGFLMVNRSWFPDASDETIREVTLEKAHVATLRTRPSRQELEDLAIRIHEHLVLRGRPGRELPERGVGGTWIFRFERPGTLERVAVRPGRTEAVLTIRRHGLVTTLAGFHHVSGFGGGARYSLWAFCVDAVGLAILLFAASGICLWYRLERDHRLGWLALGSGAGYVVGLLLFLLLRA